MSPLGIWLLSLCDEDMICDFDSDSFRLESRKQGGWLSDWRNRMIYACKHMGLVIRDNGRLLNRNAELS